LLEVLSRLSKDHDIRLVVVAGAVCLLSACAAFGLYVLAQRRALAAVTEAAARLAAARDEAEAANRTRGEFLAAMSHELRTPLNGVRGMIQALGATPLTPEQRDMLRTLDASAHTLQRELASLFAAAGANAQWARIERPAPTPPARRKPAAAAARTAAPPAPSPEPPQPKPPGADRPVRILIAEDHPVNRKVLSLILSTTNPELSFAEDGAEAVEALRAGRFDIVFMDMQMSRVDGLEATRALRLLEQETGAPRTPVVMLTAHALPEHAEASLAAGADRHLTKPVSAVDVLAVLQEFCGPGAKPRSQAA
jgi:CheY-like chemotaxis protein